MAEATLRIAVRAKGSSAQSAAYSAGNSATRFKGVVAPYNISHGFNEGQIADLKPPKSACMRMTVYNSYERLVDVGIAP